MKSCPPAAIPQIAGFSLLEVLVALAITALTVGGVAGVYGVQADALKQSQQRKQDMVFLEAAMQALLVGKLPLQQGPVSLGLLPEATDVRMSYELSERSASGGGGVLVHVSLRRGASVLETSLLLAGEH